MLASHRLGRAGFAAAFAVASGAALAGPGSLAPEALGLGPAAARAAPPNAASTPRVDQIVRYLQDAQNADGGWGGRVGGASDSGFTAWVAMALAAGGVNPQDQAKPGGGVDAYTYLTRHAGELTRTTDFERVMLSAVAAGAPVRDFGGVDLVARILERQRPDGSFPLVEGGELGAVNATAFAILPLSALGDPALDAAIARAADWLVEVQDESGGWGHAPGAGVGSDMTASVIEALRAAGRADTDAERRGWAYLRRTHLEADGGFTVTPQGDVESNTASTAWTVQGMWAAGIEPEGWTSAPPSPLDYLTSMMDPATGEIRWKRSEDQNPVWMTAYAGPAFAGYPLPIPVVARATSRPEPAASTPTPTPAPPGEGVTAGGGGEGAPIFSKPEPGSRGRTGGGVRRVNPTAQEREARSSTKRRRDRAERERTRRTAASNGVDDDGVTRDVAPVRDRRGAGGAGQAPEGGGTADTGLGPGEVGGAVIAAPRSGIDGTGDDLAAAPGLRSADEDRAHALAAGLAALLLIGLATGMNLERQRVSTAR